MPCSLKMRELCRNSRNYSDADETFAQNDLSVTSVSSSVFSVFKEPIDFLIAANDRTKPYDDAGFAVGPGTVASGTFRKFRSTSLPGRCSSSTF